MKEVAVQGKNLAIEDVVEVALHNVRTRLSEEAIPLMEASRAFVLRSLEEGRAIYGVTTGFGRFSQVLISPEDSRTLQRNLIRSHATGVGDPLPVPVVRATMLLRANTLAKGHSGVRPELVETLISMLNAGVHPIIPEKGSLGASGDLAPLAHMSLVLIGEGEAEYKGERLPGAEAMRRAGIPVVELQPKEGLALINGTPLMTAIGSLTLHTARILCRTADVVAAMTADSLGAVGNAFDERLHTSRGHPGQMDSAANLRRVVAGSKLITRPGEVRIQDAYSIRCTPQVHGASRDAMGYAWAVLGREINAATDNPLFFPSNSGSGTSCYGSGGDALGSHDTDEISARDDHGAVDAYGNQFNYSNRLNMEVISGGNFHGQPVALAMDFLGIALSELANISERRTEHLLNPMLSGLPAFLTEHGGLNSGFMIAQYTAAALVSENKILASPASVDSIPTSANQEDHVSMGTIAARKARQIAEHVAIVLAIEALCAAQALDFRGVEKAGAGTKAAYRRIREAVPHLDDDRILHDDIEKVRRIVESGELLEAVETEVGRLL
ncbi:MAG TPA: histidine ammonia-lyase [Clostridia bacterium]|nr:histidine ammonia-lyase [Clostridia bacterium]